MLERHLSWMAALQVAGQHRRCAVCAPAVPATAASAVRPGICTSALGPFCLGPCGPHGTSQRRHFPAAGAWHCTSWTSAWPPLSAWSPAASAVALLWTGAKWSVEACTSMLRYTGKVILSPTSYVPGLSGNTPPLKCFARFAMSFLKRGALRSYSLEYSNVNRLTLPQSAGCISSNISISAPSMSILTPSIWGYSCRISFSVKTGTRPTGL
mmetsp:Transcript_87795/g.243517  ORF Transcript_87795/g.243517 Transcript_87795/m.243517 type:complete len:211 (-) Transcript_87795:961-1593(-)